MKTKTYLGLSVATVLTILASCNSQSTKTDAITESVQTNGIITQPQPKKYTIPVNDIKSMIGKYRSERQELTNRNSNLQRSYGESFQDTRCAWFSIDDLKSFIAEVEKDPKNKLSGIRMYYTVYPEKTEGESKYMSSISEKERNHVSLLLIPTYYDQSNQTHIDFGPEEDTDGKKKDTDETDVKAKGAAAAAIAPQQAPGLNHAALCPPNCPTFSGSSYLND